MNFTGFHMVNIIDSGAKSSQILSGVITEDKDLDDAIRMWPKIIDFISQPSKQKASYEESVSELLKLYK